MGPNLNKSRFTNKYLGLSSSGLPDRTLQLPVSLSAAQKPFMQLTLLFWLVLFNSDPVFSGWCPVYNQLGPELACNVCLKLLNKFAHESGKSLWRFVWFYKPFATNSHLEDVFCRT